MNDEKNFAEADALLTAYALGELEGEERAAVEIRLRDDPAARAAVAEIRAFSSQLASALAAEALVESESLPAALAAPVAAASERNMKSAAAGRSAARRRARWGSILEFPQLYFLASGLAAACFLLIFLQYTPERREQLAGRKVYREISLDDFLPAASAPKDSAAPGAGAAGAVAATDSDVVRLEPFEVAADSKALSAAGSAKERPRAIYLASGKGSDFESQAQMAAATRDRSFFGPGESLAQKKEADSSSPMIVAGVSGAPRVAPAAADRLVSENNIAAAPALAAAKPGVASPFISAATAPVATYAADGDTEGFRQVAQEIRLGQRPAAEAVRIEDLINAMPAAPAATNGDAQFAARLEVAEAPWATQHRLARVELQAREPDASTRPPAHLVFVIDISSAANSANGLPLVKESLRTLIGRLRPEDRVALVTYSGSAGAETLLPLTPVSRQAEIYTRLAALQATVAQPGQPDLQHAFDLIEADYIKGGRNEVVLCAGATPAGVADEKSIYPARLRSGAAPVTLSVLRFGVESRGPEDVLARLARLGHGRDRVVHSRTEAAAFFAEELGEALPVVASDVRVQVEFNPAEVASYRLLGFENHGASGDRLGADGIRTPSIAAGQSVTALFEIIPAEKRLGAEAARSNSGAAAASLPQNIAGNSPAAANILKLNVRFQDPRGRASRELDFPLRDRGERFAEASPDFKLSAAVAGFGMLLHDSPARGSTTYASVTSWAEGGGSGDASGWRDEFVDLVKRAEALPQ